MNYNKIKKIAVDKGVSLNFIASEISMTEIEFNYALRYKTLRVIDLENIANILNVQATEFFNQKTGHFNQNYVEKIENSTVFHTNEGNVNYKNREDDIKIKYRELKRLNLFYSEFIQNSMDLMADIMVKFIEHYPDSLQYMKKQKEVKKFIMNVNTLKNLNKTQFILNEDFFNYFEKN